MEDDTDVALMESLPDITLPNPPEPLSTTFLTRDEERCLQRTVPDRYQDLVDQVRN